MKNHIYYTYITTSPHRKVLYIGITNNLKERLNQHLIDSMGEKTTFAGKYLCYNLLYFEVFDQVMDAINRETELKKWSRSKKEGLIEKSNPNWDFLNNKI